MKKILFAFLCLMASTSFASRRVGGNSYVLYKTNAPNYFYTLDIYDTRAINGRRLVLTPQASPNEAVAYGCTIYSAENGISLFKCYEENNSFKVVMDFNAGSVVIKDITYAMYQKPQDAPAAQ